MKPLEGLRVLDLTHMVSGPYAGMMLADLGAETIKVEPPGGEGTRRLLADDPRNTLDGQSAYYITLNRNKKSVTLNLKHPTGLALFYELVGHADVVLDNFSTGVMDRLHIDYAHLAPLNPRIITCSVTGFGQTGPGADRVAFDLVVQALGGGMSLSGPAGGPPTRFGPAIGDIGGGIMAVIGIQAALIARATTGRGQHVDISMLDAQFSLLNYIVTVYALSGQVPTPLGNAHFIHVPYNSYPTSDGFVIIAIITDEFWKQFVRNIPELADLDTPEHERQPGRLRNQALIDGRISALFRTNTQAHWLQRLAEARVPSAPVNSVAQAAADPQIVYRNMFPRVATPQGHETSIPGNPIKLSGTPAETFDPAPLLGQHNSAIYGGLLGKSAEQLAALRDAGVI
jgi:crotonobetainyl-CoA:carnitine CoA-transferase CaiB-like acyl-CoA transferase